MSNPRHPPRASPATRAIPTTEATATRRATGLRLTTRNAANDDDPARLRTSTASWPLVRGKRARHINRARASTLEVIEARGHTAVVGLAGGKRGGRPEPDGLPTLVGRGACRLGGRPQAREDVVESLVIEARVLGLDVVADSLEIRRRVGYLAQLPRFYDELGPR